MNCNSLMVLCCGTPLPSSSVAAGLEGHGRSVCVMPCVSIKLTPFYSWCWLGK
jgi:hypothetical protein